MTSFRVRINTNRCKGCYLCVSVCPKNVLEKDACFLNKSGYYAAKTISEQECVGCISCALMCPDGAISLYRDEDQRRSKP